MLDQFRDVGLHILRRNAPGFLGEQDFALGAVRHTGPELAVQELAVRFDQNSRFGQLVFVLAENLPQFFDFVVHAVQHLPHRIYFDFPAFKFFESETDGKMLCQLHQHILIQLLVFALFGQSSQCVPQCVLRA